MIIEGRQSRRIEAPPGRLWSMVADVTRMGEWNPETFACRWTSEPGPRVGATFEGCNRLSLVGTWCSQATVTRCDPDRSFGFVIGRDAARPNTEWLFSFEPAPRAATVVTESYRMIREPLVVRLYYLLIRRRRQLDRGVATTLERLRRAGESDAPTEDVHPMSRVPAHPASVPQPHRSSIAGAVPPGEAWAASRRGETRILDLRSRGERTVWGWPPGAKKVSLLAHSFRPDVNAIYLCQHAVRSKVPLRRGAREVDGGFKAWLAAGLPIESGPMTRRRGPTDSPTC